MPYDKEDPQYQLLLDEKVGEFNDAKSSDQEIDLQGALFRGIDLRNLNADGLNFSDAYFRSADLRGIDFRKANLEGASLCDAKISGCYFPKQLSPNEIQMSVERGTRLRYSG